MNYPALRNLSLFILVNERHFISTILKRLRDNSLSIVVAILIALNVFVLTKHVDTANALQSTQAQVIKEKNARVSTSKRLSETLEQKTTIDASLREERLKTAQKDEEIQSLKVNLQAKKEAEAKAAQQAQVAVKPQPAAPVATNVTGDKASWLAASGIPQEHWGLVDAIVTRESGWNPNAVNASSGACGLGQQLPCGKWAGAWNDPVAALVAMNGYVNGRYGGWPQANAFWNANHWY